MKIVQAMSRGTWLVTPDKFLGAQQVHALRRTLEAGRRGGDRYAVRNAAIVETLLGTGLRVSELCGLVIADLFLDRGSGNVLVRRGKGGKSRLVAISAGLATYLVGFVTWKASVGESTSPTSPVFLSERRHRMHRSAVHRLALEATGTRVEGLRRRWSEGPKQRLEDLLGEIVVGLEAIAGALAEERRRHEEERRAEQQRRDEQELERRRTAKRQALAEHLVETAQRWREAATVRDFLSAMSEQVPVGRRSPEFARWFGWANEYVEQHDPLGEPDRVVRSLEPDRPA